MNEHNQEIDRTTWFASFAPYEPPALRGGGPWVESGIMAAKPALPIGTRTTFSEAILKSETDRTTTRLHQALRRGETGQIKMSTTRSTNAPANLTGLQLGRAGRLMVTRHDVRVQRQRWPTVPLSSLPWYLTKAWVRACSCLRVRW